MKYVREHINEKFSEDSDPVHDMGIGIRNFWEKTLQKERKLTNVESSIKYFGGNAGYEDEAWCVYKVAKEVINSKCTSSKDVQEIAENALNVLIFGAGYADINLHKVIEALNDVWKMDVKIFTPKNPHKWKNIYEKFSEDSDPIHDMGIGMIKQIRNWLISKNVKPDFKDEVNEILAAVCEYDKIEYLEFLLSSNILNKTYEDLINACGNAAYEDKMDICKIFIRYGVNIDDVLEEFHIRNCPISHKNLLKLKGNIEFESVNEKFEENTDPIHDMGIGIFIKRNFDNRNELYKFLHKYLLLIINEETLPDDFIIVCPGMWHMKKPYGRVIHNFIKKYITINNEAPDLDNIFYVSGLGERLDNGVLHVKRGDPRMEN